MQIGLFAVDGLPVYGDAGQGYAEVTTGGPTIALHCAAMVDSVRPHGGTMLQFRCDDVRGVVEQARARGGVIAVEPVETDWGTLSAYLSGPHGVLIELYSWVKTPSSAD